MRKFAQRRRQVGSGQTSELMRACLEDSVEGVRAALVEPGSVSRELARRNIDGRSAVFAAAYGSRTGSRAGAGSSAGAGARAGAGAGATASAEDEDEDKDEDKDEDEAAGGAAVLALLLDEYGLASSIPTARDRYGLTPLHLAAHVQSAAAVDLLLAAGAVPDAKDKAGRTPLHLLFTPPPPPPPPPSSTPAEIAKTLLDAVPTAAADAASQPDKAGVTPLMMAAAADDAAAVVLLLAAGADAAMRDRAGRGVLHYAAYGGFAAFEAVVTALGTDAATAALEAPDKSGALPLHAAAAGLQPQVAIHIMDVYGLAPTALDDKGRSVLFAAVAAAGSSRSGSSIESEEELLINALLFRGAYEPHRPGTLRSRPNPIHLAIANGNLAVVDALVKGAAAEDDRFTPNILDAHDRSLVHYASYGASVPAIMKALALLDSASPQVTFPINAADDAGLTAAHIAAAAGSLGSLQAIVPQGGELGTFSDAGFAPIHLAALNGRAEVVSFLLDAGVRPGARSGRAAKGVTALHLAALIGSRPVIDVLLGAGGPELLALADARGRIPLHWAALGGAVATLDVLVRHADQLSARDSFGMTPLALAVQCGHEDMAREFMARSASIVVRDDADRSLVHYAARNAQRDMIRDLVGDEDYLPELMGPDALGWSPLAEAIFSGDEGSLRILMRSYDDVLADACDAEPPALPPLPAPMRSGATLVHVAAYRGIPDALESILEELDVDDAVDNSACPPIIDAQDDRGMSALHYAVLGAGRGAPGSPSAHPWLKLLPLGSADSDSDSDFGGNTASDDDDDDDDASTSSASDDFNSVFHVLARAGASLDLADANGRTPLHCAAALGLAPVVLLLCDLGADASLLDSAGLSPLATSVLFGHTQALQALFHAGAPPLTRNHALETPLHLAMGIGSLDAASAIISYLADDDSDDDDDDDDDNNNVTAATATASATASVDEYSDGDVFLTFIAPSPLNAPDMYGSVPLHVAAAVGFLAGAQALVEAGAAVDSLDSAGRTPLHVALLRAATPGSPQADALAGMVELLGSSVTAVQRDDFGSTPLHAAAVVGSSEVFGALLGMCSAPCGTTLLDPSGHSPLSLALVFGHLSLAADIVNGPGALPPPIDHIPLILTLAITKDCPSVLKAALAWCPGAAAAAGPSGTMPAALALDAGAYTALDALFDALLASDAVHTVQSVFGPGAARSVVVSHLRKGAASAHIIARVAALDCTVERTHNDPSASSTDPSTKPAAAIGASLVVSRAWWVGAAFAVVVAVGAVWYSSQAKAASP